MIWLRGALCLGDPRDPEAPVEDCWGLWPVGVDLVGTVSLRGGSYQPYDSEVKTRVIDLAPRTSGPTSVGLCCKLRAQTTYQHEGFLKQGAPK